MMVRLIMLAALVLAAAGAVMGKDSPATRPGNDEVAALRAEVESLRRENAELRRELALARNAPAATKPAGSDERIKRAVASHNIVVGMTERDVRNAVYTEADIVDWQHQDTEQLEGGEPVTYRQINIGSRRYGNWRIVLRDNRVVRVER